MTRINSCFSFHSFIGLVLGLGMLLPAPDATSQDDPQTTRVRVATFNVALNRPAAGELARELAAGQSSQARKVAEVIQRVRPDVILLNEVDYDDSGMAIELLQSKYLSVSQNGQAPIEFAHTYAGPVNTGVDSQLDLNGDGKTGTPDDAFGFGTFPGQYGMAVLSRLPIDRPRIRTFQKFLWKDMPGANLPVDPKTGQPYYSIENQNRIRLSSKSHWDLPIDVGRFQFHLLCAHPTPPVFDGPEDRNGRRNHDEIRLLADYVGGKADYLYDDNSNRGGLDPRASFVIAGDMNADPADGDSFEGAASLLMDHPRLRTSPVPTSKGSAEAARTSGGANAGHNGDNAADTGDFSDARVGNLRVDYVLPSSDLRLLDCGVFWPASGEPGFELNDASDHHLVWIDFLIGKSSD